MSASTAQVETFVLERPTDVSDADWNSIKARAHKVATGHYAWCTEHEGDPGDPDSYCETSSTSWYGRLTLNTGTLTGVPLIWVDLPDEGGTLHELEVPHAEALGEALLRLAQTARQAAGVPA